MTVQKQLIRIAMLTALTVAISLLVIFPVPGTNGFVTFSEVGIYTSAVLLGPLGGFWVGALSGGLIDLFSGYPQWILPSVIIHSIQGAIAGYFFQKQVKILRAIGFLTASCWMVAGYALATALLYSWPAGIASLPGNIIQTVFGVVLTLLLMRSLSKTNHLLMKEGSE